MRDFSVRNKDTAVRPAVRWPLTPISHNAISLHSGGISMKLDTKIYRVSGNFWKGFQGQRSWPDQLTVMAEAYISHLFGIVCNILGSFLHTPKICHLSRTCASTGHSIFQSVPLPLRYCRHTLVIWSLHGRVHCDPSCTPAAECSHAHDNAVGMK